MVVLLGKGVCAWRGMFSYLLTSFLPSEHLSCLCSDFANTMLSCRLEGKPVGLAAHWDAGWKKQGLLLLQTFAGPELCARGRGRQSCSAGGSRVGQHIHRVEETPLSCLLPSRSSNWDCSPHPSSFSPFLVCMSILF